MADLCFLIKKYFSFALKFLVYEFKSFITDAKHIYTVQSFSYYIRLVLCLILQHEA